MSKITLADLLNEMKNDVVFTMEFVSAQKTKQGGHVTMGVAPGTVEEMAIKDNKIPILIMADKDKFNKARENLLNKIK